MSNRGEKIGLTVKKGEPKKNSSQEKEKETRNACLGGKKKERKDISPTTR